MSPIDVLVPGVGPEVQLHAERCLRGNLVVQARRACTCCDQVCPKGALHLNATGVVHDPDRCQDCQLCLSSCPTAAIQPSAWARQSYVEEISRVPGGAEIHFACSRAPGSATPDLIRRRCLGGLCAEFYVLPLLLGASRLTLVTGDCGSCPLGHADAIERACAQATRVVSVLGLGALRWRRCATVAGHANSLSPRGPALSRRQMLGFVRGRLSQVVRQVGAEVIEQRLAWLAPEPGNAKPQSPLWARRWIQRLLPAPTPAPRLVDAQDWSGRPQVDSERCQRCGICAAACVGDALVLRTGAEQASQLEFVPHLCSGCGSCQRACPERALHLHSVIDLNEWAQEHPVVLAPPQTQPCARCGQAGPLVAAGLCSACYQQRRLGWPGTRTHESE